MLVYNEYPEFPFGHKNVVTDKSVQKFVANLFDNDLKESLDFVLDLKDYFRKGKYGKL
jgi:hypothetical protein